MKIDKNHMEEHIDEYHVEKFVLFLKNSKNVNIANQK